MTTRCRQRIPIAAISSDAFGDSFTTAKIPLYDCDYVFLSQAPINRSLNGNKQTFCLTIFQQFSFVITLMKLRFVTYRKRFDFNVRCKAVATSPQMDCSDQFSLPPYTVDKSITSFQMVNDDRYKLTHYLSYSSNKT
jgi:hypothetical protein